MAEIVNQNTGSLVRNQTRTTRTVRFTASWQYLGALKKHSSSKGAPSLSNDKYLTRIMTFKQWLRKVDFLF